MNLPAFYPILDTDVLAGREIALKEAAAIVLDAGVRMLQIRHKGRFGRALYNDALKVAGLCRDAGARLVIDDRADVAALLDAGVHIGQEDLPPPAARAIVGPDRIIGFSTHNAAQFESALLEPVDYVALGPIFATGSKMNPDAVVGLEELARLRAFSPRPLVAIGGITRRNASDVLAAGADSIAVIGDLYPDDCTRQTLRQRTEEWLALLK